MKSPSLTQRTHARSLRRQQTDAERRLWSCLRNRQVVGAKFRRQFPIGPYIADFCCLEVGLIVELDGGQHAEQSERDERRTLDLEGAGFVVMRFWNNEVLIDTDPVVEQIAAAIEERRRQGCRYGVTLPGHTGQDRGDD